VHQTARLQRIDQNDEGQRAKMFHIQLSDVVRGGHVIDVDMMVTSVANDAGTSAEYIDAAVKPERVVVTVDKKALDLPNGMLAFLNDYSLYYGDISCSVGISCLHQRCFQQLSVALMELRIIVRS